MTSDHTVDLWWVCCVSSFSPCTYVFLNSYYSDILTTCLTLKRLGNRTTMFQVRRSLSYCRASSTSRWVCCCVSSVCCSAAVKTAGPPQITDLRNCAFSFKMHSCVELHKSTSRMTQNRSDTVKRPRQNNTTSFSQLNVSCKVPSCDRGGPPLAPPPAPEWCAEVARSCCAKAPISSVCYYLRLFSLERRLLEVQEVGHFSGNNTLWITQRHHVRLTVTDFSDFVELSCNEADM